MSAAPLELEGLARSFGAFELGPLSLRVEPNQYWVLLGPSGCGKSMLLQTVCGFHRARQGVVRLGGRDATTEPPEARAIGLVFQDASLFPHCSVSQNVEFGLLQRRWAPADRAQRVAEVVAALGLERLLERPVATLSGGEAQRVAIARAVAAKPGLLLLDEPLSLLDHNTRLELQGRLRQWHQQLGVSILHVTHNRDEARAVGTHCAVMLGGRLVQAGPLEEVFSRPRCPFVHRFLGAPGPAPECGDPPASCPPGCDSKPNSMRL